MKVSELAQSLELPASAVLDQCERLGLDAGWAGAELSATDVAVLQAELASEDPVASTPPVPPTTEAWPAASATHEPSGLSSPSAVGSIPGLVDELEARPIEPAPAPRLPGGIGAAPAPAAAATPPSPDGERPTFTKSRRWEPSLRPAVVGLVIAAAAFVASNAVEHPVAIVALWVVVVVALVVSLLGGNRARYHITNHPDQRKGLGLAVVALVLAVAATVGFGAVLWTTFRTEPPRDAPAGLGDLSSVQRTRWSQQRLWAVMTNGWHRPAKDVGTCWEADDSGRGQEERVEVGGDSVDCSDPHGFEVIGAYAVDRDADSPYPGVDALRQFALDRCQAAQQDLRARPEGLNFVVEYPTEKGWDDADHDVTCVAAALTARRIGG